MKNSSLFLLSIIITLNLTLQTLNSHAQQPGSLDNTFNTNGKVNTAIGSSKNDIAYATAIQNDGKIVVAGSSDNQFAVARYNADGSLDNTFDLDGKLSTNFGTSSYTACSIAIQNDGKIVVAGTSTYNIVIARYNSNGSLDTTFDGDGKLISSFGSGINYVKSVAIQSNGKIVVAGSYSYSTSAYAFALARFNSNGSLDTSFDGDGIVTTSFLNYTPFDYANSIAIQSDGKIVAAGSSSIGATGYFALARYNSNGSLDTTFSGDGKLNTSLGGGGDVYSIAIQSDGKIVAAGTSKKGTNMYDFALARYNNDGSLDTTFDFDGKLTTAIVSGDNRANSVVIQSDGKIVAAGYSNNGTNHDFALARYNSDGSLDTTFDIDGKLIIAIGSNNDEANSVIIQNDGKIVTAGFSFGADNDFALARFNNDGSFDNTFEMDGKLTTTFGYGIGIVQGMALQSDGKIVAVGSSNNNDFALARYNSDGSLDSTFDIDGTVITNFGSTNDIAYSVAIQTDGKIVAAGSSNGRFALARYNSNGSLDSTFDADGKLTTSLYYSDVAYAVALQSDGKIVAAGSYNNSNNTDFALVRYNNNGSLDSTFSGDGKLTTAFGSSFDDIAYSIAIQSDGKIVAAGYSASNGINKGFALARYNSNGSLDATFDTDGKLTTNIGLSDAIAYVAAVQSDGKIVVAGYATNGGINMTYDFALARYNTDGSLDNTFDTDGQLTTDIGSDSEDKARSLAIQSNGKIIAAGYSNSGQGHNFAIARYNGNGSLDNTFNNNGKLTTDFGGVDDINSIVIQSDGKIVAAGHSDNNFALARYIGNTLTTAINENSENNSLIYPNPNNGIFVIKNDTAEIQNVEIYNVLGEKVCSFVPSSPYSNINLLDKPKGIYFVKIWISAQLRQGGDGNIIYTEKVILH